MLRARQWFFTIFFTARSSTAYVSAWFSQVRRCAALCRKSALWFATFSCSLANCLLRFRRRLLPFCCLAKACRMRPSFWRSGEGASGSQYFRRRWCLGDGRQTASGSRACHSGEADFGSRNAGRLQRNPFRPRISLKRGGRVMNGRKERRPVRFPRRADGLRGQFQRHDGDVPDVITVAAEVPRRRIAHVIRELVAVLAPHHFRQCLPWRAGPDEAVQRLMDADDLRRMIAIQ